MYDVDDFLRQAANELAEYDRHEQRLSELSQENDHRAAELRQRRETAWSELGALAVPQADEAHLSALADQVRLPGLRSLAEELAARRAEIARRLAEIEALPQYAEREVRRIKVERQLEEDTPYFELARNELQKLDALPGMRELVEDRWGTPEYKHRGWLRFFDPEYLKDWRNADNIVEALKISHFTEAAALFNEKLEQVKVLDEMVRGLQNQLSEIEGLELERANLLAEQVALPATLQRRAGQMLGQMFQTRGKEGVRDLPVPEDALRVFAAIEGIDHQIRYLEEMNGKIREDMQQLLQRSGRLREERQRYESDRYRYRNKRFTADQFGKRFGRSGRYSKVHDRYSRMSERVYAFNNYDRGATWEDFLWWDVMTDGRFDGNFIPEVAEWRGHHPSYEYVAHHHHQHDHDRHDHDRHDFDSSPMTVAGFETISSFDDNS